MIQSPNMDKRIILCADDYGQNEAISLGILTLVHKSRINAVSCMVNGSYWVQASGAIADFKSSTYLGLHLNLTEGKALSAAWKIHHGADCLTLPTLIKKAYLRRLNVQVVAAEIEAQIAAFVQAMKVNPDFIDGHQHVHQLPIVRDALLLVYKRLGLKALIRSTSIGWRDLWLGQGFPKRPLIALLGGVVFRRALVKQGITCNSNFSGIYPFGQSSRYRHYFKQFLSQVQDGGLIMCHPGNPSDDKQDPLSACRHHELNYFLSDNFLLDLKMHATQLLCKGAE